MNLATPAPRVETAMVEPIRNDKDSVRIDPAKAVEPAEATPAPRVDAAKPYNIDDLRTRQIVTKTSPNTWSVETLRTAAGVKSNQEGLSQKDEPKHPQQDGADNAGKSVWGYFEGYAAVIRGPPTKNFLRLFLPCIFDERDFVAYGEVKYFVAVWGSVCFVYAEEHSLKPYYAIDLTQYVVVEEDRDNPDPKSFTVSPEPDTNKPRRTMVTILFKSKKNHSQAYQFSFETINDPKLAQRFLNVVQRNQDSKTIDMVEGVIIEEDMGDRKENVNNKK